MVREGQVTAVVWSASRGAAATPLDGADAAQTPLPRGNDRLDGPGCEGPLDVVHLLELADRLPQLL